MYDNIEGGLVCFTELSVKVNHVYFLAFPENGSERNTSF